MQYLWNRLQGTGNKAILARGAIGVLLVKVAGVGLLFGLHVLLARLLGTEQYGIYVYALAWINILVVFCLLGFQTSLVRFIAEYTVRQQWNLLRGIIRRSTQTVLASSIIVSGIGTIIITFKRHQIGDEVAIPFCIAFVLLPLFSLCRLQEASLRALKCAVQAEFVFSIVRPLMLGLAVLCLFYLLQGSINTVHAMTCNVVSVLAVFLIDTALLRRSLPVSVRHTPPAYAQSQWVKVSLSLLLAATMHKVLNRTDIVMLGIFLETKEVGPYSAASNIASLIILGLVATSAIAAPIISELYHTGNKEKLQTTLTLAARGIFIFTIVAGIILVILGKYALGFFGPEFVVAYVPLVILLVGLVINASSGLVGLIMAMTGHQNQAGIILTSCAVINIALNAVLIPAFGLSGAAVSTTITMALWNIAMIIYVRYKLQINPTVFQRTKQCDLAT